MNKTSIIVLALALGACSKEPPPPKPVDNGRPETRSLEAADAMGYNGKEVRQKVDKALDANDANIAAQREQLDQN